MSCAYISKREVTLLLLAADTTNRSKARNSNRSYSTKTLQVYYPHRDVTLKTKTGNSICRPFCFLIIWIILIMTFFSAFDFTSIAHLVLFTEKQNSCGFSLQHMLRS